MTKSMFLVMIFILVVRSFSFSQVTKLWESPASTVAFPVNQIGSLKIAYYYQRDDSAKSITLFDATSFSMIYSIPNPDSSGVGCVIPDINGNGYPEIVMYGYRKNITIRDLHTGAVIVTFDPPSGYNYQYYEVGETIGDNVLKMFIVKLADDFSSQALVVYSLGVTAPASVSETKTNTPSTLTLEQNYPNPFNPSTTIQYEIPTQAIVQITIYDISGRLLRTIRPGEQAPGIHTVVWDGKDHAGYSVSSGSYFYQVKVGEAVQIKKAMLIR